MREGLQRLLLMSAPGWEWFDEAIIDHCKTIRRARFHFDENVACKFAAMCALLDDCERPRTAKAVPDLRELAGEERSENRSDADVGKEIAAAPDHRAARRIITVHRMVQGRLHEFVK